ncbi:Ig-like domain-containing protein, partial [Acidobacteriota bacterium]
MRSAFYISIFTAAALLFPCAFTGLRSAHAGETEDRQPVIFAGYMSHEGEIDPSTVKIYLDDQDVTSKAQVTHVRVSYKPDTPLDPGAHSVRVIVGSGDNTAVEEWTFAVIEGDEGDINVFIPRSLKVIFLPLRTPTSDPVHTIRGISLPGAQVELFVNGLPLGTEVALDNGIFSFPFVQLEEGRNRVSAVATLTDTGETSPLRHLRPDPFLDTEPPVILNLTPKKGTKDLLKNIAISAQFSDRRGIGINPTHVVLTLDGSDITHQATVTGSGLRFKPATDLTPGRHSVGLEVHDLLGNANQLQQVFMNMIINAE